MTFTQACKVFAIPAKHATWRMVRDLYRELARSVHPDAGGNREDWDVLQEAYRALRLAFSVPTTCKACRGEGVVMGPKFVITKCPICNGKGELPPQVQGLTS